MRNGKGAKPISVPAQFDRRPVAGGLETQRERGGGESAVPFSGFLEAASSAASTWSLGQFKVLCTAGREKNAGVCLRALTENGAALRA